MPTSIKNARARAARVPTIAFALSLFAVLLAPLCAFAAAPTISGTPTTAVTVGTYYYFLPAARDADGNTLTFSIQNKPSFLAFSTTSGRLSNTATKASVGTYSNIVIKVSDGVSSAALPAFSITVNGSGTTNKPPVISGTPSTSVKSGSAYAFTPTASDPEGKPLTFSITNKPAWATFSTTTGKLSGTPSSAQTGTYSNISIKVSDGSLTASLPTFAIVVSTTTTTGSATLSWTPPTRNTDGSTLTDLAGYRILYGTSPSSLTQTLQVANPGVSRYVVENLAAGTWYFSVRAYSTGGGESSSSNTASTSVP